VREILSCDPIIAIAIDYVMFGIAAAATTTFVS
jgi:hypothetical protein